MQIRIGKLITLKSREEKLLVPFPNTSLKPETTWDNQVWCGPVTLDGSSLRLNEKIISGVKVSMQMLCWKFPFLELGGFGLRYTQGSHWKVCLETYFSSLVLVFLIRGKKNSKNHQKTNNTLQRYWEGYLISKLIWYLVSLLLDCNVKYYPILLTPEPYHLLSWGHRNVNRN